MRIQNLAAGRAGAIQTLDEMRRLTIEAIHSQAPRYKAVELMRVEWVTEPEMFVNAILNWMLTHIDIVDEFEELLISPLVMIREIDSAGRTAGDCDDCAMLAAALLASVGAMVQLVACFPQPDETYAHVFTRYKFPRQSEWMDFDATIGYTRPVYPADVLTVDIIS